jgi:hypothetical protein
MGHQHFDIDAEVVFSVRKKHIPERQAWKWSA